VIDQLWFWIVIILAVSIVASLVKTQTEKPPGTLALRKAT
jgi:hypothetical protein